MEKLTGIFFLHGFLGRPSDWDFIKNEISKNQNIRTHAVDYLNHPEFGPNFTFNEWAENFNKYVQSFGYSKNILIGYSLGGRLALHALQQSPNFWSLLVILSANPGLNSVQEKQARLANDETWAHKFSQMQWQDVMRDWNLQPVFAGNSNEPMRIESDYVREKVAKCLVQWSLGKQENLSGLIRQHQDRISWAVGALDKKFLHMSAAMYDENILKDLKIFDEASHRIIFDQPQALALWIKQIIKL